MTSGPISQEGIHKDTQNLYNSYSQKHISTVPGVVVFIRYGYDLFFPIKNAKKQEALSFNISFIH